MAVPAPTHPRHAPLLQCLHPINMLPEEYSARSQALTMLKRIESIEIVETIKRDGHRYYVVGIYFKLSRSHIPTADIRGVRSSARRPDAHVEHRLYEFGNLRDEMYYFAHNGHGNRPCACCRAIVDYVVHGAKPRTLLRWLDGTEGMHATLTQFLNDVLRLTTQVKVYGGLNCQGQETIPTQLKQFLFPIAHDAGEPSV